MSKTGELVALDAVLERGFAALPAGESERIRGRAFRAHLATREAVVRYVVELVAREHVRTIDPDASRRFDKALEMARAYAAKLPTRAYSQVPGSSKAAQYGGEATAGMLEVCERYHQIPSAFRDAAGRAIKGVLAEKPML